jgi:hypothetical protein
LRGQTILPLDGSHGRRKMKKTKKVVVVVVAAVKKKKTLESTELFFNHIL